MQVPVTPSDVPLIPLPSAPLLQVLLVCARGEHLQKVRCLARRWPQAAHVHWIPDPEDALQHARASVPQLAIVDARLERACASSLSTRLRSVSPDLVVMNFDAPSGMHGDAPDSHWHWSELDKATDWWVRRHFRAQAQQRPPTVQ
ncbi:hypothetical protein [Hydrogenophaga sp.]|uniref:hypothetical protein n=1 Tax=Hydrogenophaga sp. TaxID=1904254 RepID=UPI003AF9075C